MLTLPLSCVIINNNTTYLIYIKTKVCPYSERPKSESSDFGRFHYRSVPKQFGFRGCLKSELFFCSVAKLDHFMYKFFI